MRRRELGVEGSLVGFGLALMAVPGLLTAVDGTRTWEAEVARWWGLSLVLLAWSLRSIGRRRLAVDRMTHWWSLLGPVVGLAGMVTGRGLFLLFGFATTVGVACRAWLTVGFDVHRVALRRLRD